ncbi:MAG: copper amine oxidase N-terminal domain-containing protein [Clostridiales bacterium]
MKKERKKVLALALSMLLLSNAGSLAAMNTAEADPGPVGTHLPEAAAGAAGFRLPANPTDNILIDGTLTKLDNGHLRLTSKEDNAPYQEIELIMADNTAIFDGTSGQPLAIEDLKDGEKLYAYISAPSDRDLPPQVTAQVVLGRLAEDKDLPGYFEVRSTIANEAEAVRLVTDKDMVLRIEDRYMPEAFKTVSASAPEKVSADQLVPGTRVLAWYSAVSLSMPAQTSPSRIIALPYDYNGYVELTPEGSLYVNGNSLILDNKTAVHQNEQGFTMLPLRKVYEALGYTVTWDSASSSIILWYDDAREFGFLFDLSHAGKMAELGGTIANSATDIQVIEGVTFVSIDDLARLSNVMFARGNQV